MTKINEGKRVFENTERIKTINRKLLNSDEVVRHFVPASLSFYRKQMSYSQVNVNMSKKVHYWR